MHATIDEDMPSLSRMQYASAKGQQTARHGRALCAAANTTLPSMQLEAEAFLLANHSDKVLTC